MDKRILTKKFLIYTNVNLKLFSLLGEISFISVNIAYLRELKIADNCEYDSRER